MKKVLIFLVFLSLFACDDPEYLDLLPQKNVDYIVNMNLPQYSSLLIPGQFEETPTSIGVKGIVVYHSNSSFKAFDLACPHISLPSTCSKMSFDGSLFLTCPCDDTQFSIYNGASQSESVSQRAREYHVQNMGNNQLRITNY